MTSLVRSYNRRCLVDVQASMVNGRRATAFLGLTAGSLLYVVLEAFSVARRTASTQSMT